MNKSPATDQVTQESTTWWETADRMSHKECADFLDITPASLSSAISRGHYKFARYKVGRKQFYRKSQVLAEIESNHAA